MISGRGLAVGVAGAVAGAVGVSVAVSVGTGRTVLAGTGFGLQALNRRPPARLPRPMADKRRKSRRLRGEGLEGMLTFFYC